MPALHRTRRQFLAGIAAGGAVTVAGCGGQTSSSGTAREADYPRDGPPPGATTDFEIRTLRAPVEEPFVRVDTDENRAGGHHSYLFVLNEDEAGTLRFETDVDGEEIRTFVANTDYDTETIVIIQRRIGECYEYEAEYVELADNSFHAQFCRVLKDATTLCEAGAHETAALLLRVPKAYDDRPSSYGSGSSSRCVNDRWDEEDRS